MDKKTITDRIQASWATDSKLEYVVPKGLVPYPYQVAGLEYMLTSPDRRYLLADPMGLGKTIQAIMYANYFKIKKIIVICPALLLDKWKLELTKWTTCPDLKIQIVGKGHIDNEADVHICSYNRFVSRQVEIPKKTLAIIDECHYLRHETSKRTKFIYGPHGMIRKTKHIIAISGTAAMNRPLELYETFKALNWKAIGGRDKISYGFKFCGGYRDALGAYNFDGASNLDELGQRLRAYMMVRRNKKDVLKDLPSKSYEILRLTEQGAEKFKMEMATVKRAKVELVDHIATLRRVQGEYKVSLALPLLDEFIREEEKIVIFAHHKSVIEQLERHLAGHKLAVIKGSTPSGARQAIIDSFQNGDANVFIGSISAAGVGIELTAASTAIFVESMWTPAENDQAADRLHRIGQKKNVRIIFLTIKNDLDEYMLKRTLEKQLKLINIFDSRQKNEEKQ